MSYKLKEKTDALLSREKGTVYKDPGGRITIALVYPNIYSVGMSNLGFQGIYGLLNTMRDVVCERAFLPDDRDIEEYIRTRTEIFSLESKRPLNRFDIIAFSLSFENDYPNIGKILRLSNIPLFGIQRNALHPLLIAGGVCAFFNPEPVADFFDICFVGEADEMLPDFLSLYRSIPRRDVMLRAAAKTDGVYVPGFYSVSYDTRGAIARRTAAENMPARVRRQYLKSLSPPKITMAITTPDAEFSDMHLIEAMRGCPWNCRFCVTGRIYNPPRKKTLEDMEHEIRAALTRTRRIGLIGPSLSDHPAIREVLRFPEVDFSITSLRASAKSAEIVSLMKGHQSVSIAPEAGTERLRKVIHKKVSEEDILITSQRLLQQGINSLRLYFMVGLPTETREDIQGIIRLVEKIRGSSLKGTVTLSVSTFVPKPFTPFQWHPMELPGEVRERLKMIKDGLKNLKGIKVFHDLPKYAYMQGLFALGDRRIARALEKMLTMRDWMKACDAAGIERDSYIFRQKQLQEIFPWDFIDSGADKEALWAEYQEALSIA
ncbi:MAG: radical SAM protein [Nitrospirota bacterium]